MAHHTLQDNIKIIVPEKAMAPHHVISGDHGEADVFVEKKQSSRHESL